MSATDAARHRERYRTDPEYRERCRTRSRNARAARTPEQRAAAIARLADWKSDNPEKARETAARAKTRFAEAHPERQSEYDRRQREKDPAALRARKRAAARRERERDPQRVRARERANTLRRRGATTGERVDRDVLFGRDQGLCGLCGGTVDPMNFHVDHIVPLALGGEHSYENTQIAHPGCNMSKGAQLLGEVAA